MLFLILEHFMFLTFRDKFVYPYIIEAASTTQKDLHKEMSALRVALENVTMVASGSNMSQVQWKVQEKSFSDTA